MHTTTDEDVLEGLGDVELAAGGRRLRSVDPARAGELAALVFPPGGRGYRLRLALTSRLGFDPTPGLRTFAARGGASLAGEIDRLAALDPALGGELRRRAAGAAWLLAGGVRPAGAAAEPDADPAALARWAALPFERSRGAYLKLLRERPNLPAVLVGSWDPNAALSMSSAWAPSARARLVQLAGV